jgi:hypothetical protein
MRLPGCILVFRSTLQRVAGVAAGSFLADDHHLNQGWLVVRFSADQVRNTPDSCCKTLAEIGAELLQSPAWLEPFADVYDLWQVPDNIVFQQVA